MEEVLPCDNWFVQVYHAFQTKQFQHLEEEVCRIHITLARNSAPQVPVPVYSRRKITDQMSFWPSQFTAHLASAAERTKEKKR